MRLSRQLLVALLIVLFSAAAWFLIDSAGSKDSMPKASRTATAVNIVTPRLGMVRDMVEAVGTANAWSSVQVVSEVSGRVVRINFQDGQKVQAGQVLVELDDRQARADLQVAQAQLQDAEAKYNRARQLQSSRSISESEVDELRSNLEVARARVAAAQILLANHNIVAPFKGRLGLTDISVGTYLTPGATITTLDDSERIKLRFAVPERFLGLLRRNQQIFARSDAYPDRLFEGEVHRINSRVDPVTRSITVESLINNTEELIHPGQFMSVNLILATREDAVLIPEQSVLTEGNRQYAFVVRDGRAVQVDLVLGNRMRGEVEVLEGISAADEVIITGLARLKDGDAVTILEDPAAILSVTPSLPAILSVQAGQPR